MIYSCCNDNRKAAVLHHPTLNGIDYIEVLDNEAVPLGLTRQLTLVIYCLKAVTQTLTTDNVLIQGGESITGVSAAWVALASAPPATLPTKAKDYFTALPKPGNVILVSTNKAGDFSTYTLSLVNDATTASQDKSELTAALTGFDPQLSEVDFSFKVECGPDFDCEPPGANCPPNLPPPPINYLAKDYGSFRTVMLDRMNQLLPAWGASSEADVGVMLAELIAYVGDRFSYQQDAIATEAYLETARSRISLRRHARLVDYHVHDGCNARAWIQVQVSGIAGTGIFLDRTLTRFYTYSPGMPNTLAVGANTEEAALLSGVQVFEPLYDAVLYPENTQFSFYTWGDMNCCLAEGATEATLLNKNANLQAGDVLIFQEVKGPQTGDPADADIRHRCAVRLTAVITQDDSGNPLVDPLYEGGQPITSPGQTGTLIMEIQWAQEDALPFPVCISSTYLDENADQQTVTDVSVAYGNVILADQGLSFEDKPMGEVPAPSIYFPNTADRCDPGPRTAVPARFRPQVPDSPLTQAIPISVVALPGAGNPVTAGVQSFTAAGIAALPNTSSFTCLTLQATNPLAWPTLFGVIVKANGANIDLSVVYNPPGGAAGLNQMIAVEVFTNLSLNPADVNYAVSQVNAQSQFLRLAPPTVAATPAGFPAAPTMLPATGPVNLQDTSAVPVPYLTAQAASPLAWPQMFGVSAKPNINPTYFDLEILYDAESPAIGVMLPAVVEQFLNLSPATAAQLVDGDSSLATVNSFAQTVDLSLSASELMTLDPGKAIPAITLEGELNGVTEMWEPQQDLLSSGTSDRVFVVEVEATGVATLRFGDNTNGKMPDQGTVFTADYRVGNGSAGNVGADSVVYIAAADARIQGCRNPLPASGGTDPETVDQIRRRAPQAFQTQQRAVIMADYETVAESNAAVRQAVASLHWTGSWYTVFIAAEPQSGLSSCGQGYGQVGGQLTAVQQKNVKQTIEGFRLAGQDLQLDSPQYVSLEIELEVCVDPNYFRSHVKEALGQVLGSQVVPNGQAGFFSPTNFTFGQSVYLSPIYAAVRSVPGVVAVTATTFQIQGVNDATYLASGEIPMGPLQVARLENNPSFPDHGQLNLVMEGGK